ncbi:NUDIX hydrolase [Bacillus suaedaesalsae]|uniref:NUDIX hydrolase n=1 Tax=Bacillus suaedaesalsae TaxID=2810349 RepID=A0ABS2DK37_9BACI|nr:NUDIX hydrolase [Bacillus suaedaesalsae]MBM6618813.1 NUDIX hydrolase [Bacillus suaedaesalsae]
MKKWYGSAGVCINNCSEVLMVLQGRENELKKWTIPSGGREEGESFEECCIRELKEETGYDVEVIQTLHTKTGYYKEYEIEFEVQYFLLNVVSGEKKIQDPDNLIYDISWKSIEEIDLLDLSYPEDKEFIRKLVEIGEL